MMFGCQRREKRLPELDRTGYCPPSRYTAQSYLVPAGVMGGA